MHTFSHPESLVESQSSEVPSQTWLNTLLSPSWNQSLECVGGHPAPERTWWTLEFMCALGKIHLVPLLLCGGSIALFRHLLFPCQVGLTNCPWGPWLSCYCGHVEGQMGSTLFQEFSMVSRPISSWSTRGKRGMGIVELCTLEQRPEGAQRYQGLHGMVALQFCYSFPH